MEPLDYHLAAEFLTPPSGRRRNYKTFQPLDIISIPKVGVTLLIDHANLKVGWGRNEKKKILRSKVLEGRTPWAAWRRMVWL